MIIRIMMIMMMIMMVIMMVIIMVMMMIPSKVSLLDATVGRTLRSSANGNRASSFERVMPNDDDDDG